MSRSGGFAVEENALIEAREEGENSLWYPARIVKVDGRKVKIHYLNWNQRHDQWMSARSSRIRPLSKENAEKLGLTEQNINSEMFKLGQAIEARWIDKRFYSAKIIAIEENDFYRVLFDDGFKKKLKSHHIRATEAKDDSDLDDDLEIPESSADVGRSKRLSAREETSGTETDRSKRHSAREDSKGPETDRSKRLSAREDSTNQETDRSKRNSAREDNGGTETERSKRPSAREDTTTSAPETDRPKRTATREDTAGSETDRSKRLSARKTRSDSVPPPPPSEDKTRKKRASEKKEETTTVVVDNVVEFELPKEEASKQAEEEKCKSHVTPSNIPTEQKMKESKITIVQVPPNPKSPKTPKEGPKPVPITPVVMTPPTNNTAAIDHISQLQKNQRDQSARLMCGKGGVCYNKSLMSVGNRQAMYIPHLPMYSAPSYHFPMSQGMWTGEPEQSYHHQIQITPPTYSRQVDMRKEMLPTPALTTPIVNSTTMETHPVPKSLEIVSEAKSRQKSNSEKKGNKRPPEDNKNARKIVKKSGNQAEALKRISYDIYDFPVSMNQKISKKDSECSEESDSSATEESSTQSTPTTQVTTPQHLQPYYVNYPFQPRYMDKQGASLHQMNLYAQQYRHPQPYPQIMSPTQPPVPRGKKKALKPQSPSQVPSSHDKAIDASTAQLLRQHHLAQSKQNTMNQYKTKDVPPPPPLDPNSFRGLLECDNIIDTSKPKMEKPMGQQPQAYLSVMRLDKNCQQGPMVESYAVHGNFKTAVPRIPKPGSPKYTSNSRKQPAERYAHHATQIQKIINPARLPSGLELQQQQIYRYPHPNIYNMGHSHMFKPVSVPPPANPPNKEHPAQAPPPIISPTPVTPISVDPTRPDDSISAAIQDHLTSDNLWLADDTIDISDLANYLDGSSNAAIPEDLIDQKAEPKASEKPPEKSQTAPKQPPPTVNPVNSDDSSKKSLRERRASAKLNESSEKESSSGPSNIPLKPNKITVLPVSEPVVSTSSQAKKPRAPISDIHGTSPNVRRTSPPAIIKGVPTSPLKQKLQQYILERQARNAANKTPPLVLSESQTSQLSNKSPGSIENPLLQRRLSQSPSPTNWQQLLQYGRNSPGFIASLSPKSRAALFDIQKDPRSSPYCRTSPIPLAGGEIHHLKPELKRETHSPKQSRTIKIAPTSSAVTKVSESNTLHPKVESSNSKVPVESSKVPLEVKKETVEVPPPILVTKQTPLKKPPINLEVHVNKGSIDARLSKSVPTTPEGGYNTRKIKVQTLALLGQKPHKQKPRRSSDVSPRASPKPDEPKTEVTEKLSMKEPPKTITITPEEKPKQEPKTSAGYDPAFSSAEMISPFKDVIPTSRHLSLPSSFDLTPPSSFDDNEIFMEDDVNAKNEHSTTLDEQVVKPPMMADSDLTAPLLGDLSLGSASSSSDNVFEAPPDKKRGRPAARPRSKSHVLVTGEKRLSEDEKRKTDAKFVMKSLVNDARSSKRARSSSEPFTGPGDVADHKNRKQYYYYGEPKATKAIEPIDDHLEYKCNICKKAFPKQSRLEVHLKHYHEGKENVAIYNDDETSEPQLVINCVCKEVHQDTLLIQCDECSSWLHGPCINIQSSTIPSQYICPFCYATVKQQCNWYEDGNLPTLVESDKITYDSDMMDLHDLTEDYYSIVRGLYSTRLKIDAWARCEARQIMAKKVENVNGSWGNRKMEGTFVVIPGSSSVILPNSSTPQTNESNKNSSLVYVLSPGGSKASAGQAIRGKAVYTVNKSPLVMSLSQLRQQSSGIRGQLKPVSIRPPVSRSIGTVARGASHVVPSSSHVAAATTTPSSTTPTIITTTVNSSTSTPPTTTTVTTRPAAAIRTSGIIKSPQIIRSSVATTVVTATNTRPNTSILRMSTPMRATTTRYVPSPRHYAPKHPTANLPTTPQYGKTLQNRVGTSRLASPQSSPSGSHRIRQSPSPRMMGPNHPSNPAYFSNSRSGSPHLAGRLGSRSRPSSPRIISKSDFPSLFQRVNSSLVLATKEFQEGLAAEITESQDLLESHIAALEKKLDEFEKTHEDTKIPLGHALYDIEQLKILTQTV